MVRYSFLVGLFHSLLHAGFIPAIALPHGRGWLGVVNSPTDVGFQYASRISDTSYTKWQVRNGAGDQCQTPHSSRPPRGA